MSSSAALLTQAQSTEDAQGVVAAAQAKLGSSPGEIVLDQPSRLRGDITLGQGQDLRIAAPLQVERGTVHLLGHNSVQCQAPITVANATDLFIAEGATDVRVRGCDVTVTGRVGGYLLTATRSKRVAVSENHLVGMAVFNTHNLGGPSSETTDVSLSNNSTEFLQGGGPIGMYLLYVLRATVNGNRFRGTGHGIQWWGGDGNVGWHGAADVTRAGDLSITGNQCYQAGGACVWGSMGFNVTVSGNNADGCSDVCFDSEGGVHNLFTGNTAQACAAGCYSAQMESEDVVFSGNYAFADQRAPALALVLIKHRNGNPASHQSLTVTGNTLSCGTLCAAFYSEGESGLDLSHNTIVNGYIQFVNYTHNVHVAENSLSFYLPLTGHPAIQGPSLFNGHISILERNTLVNSATNADSVCIVQAWSDDNNTDTMLLRGNTCIGFGTGILTDTAGHNNGAPHAVWLLEGNRFSGTPAAREIVHQKQSGNESYVTDAAGGS